MLNQQQSSFQTPLMKIYRTDEIEKQTNIPFKNRVEFATIADILNRKHCHHVVLNMEFSPFISIPYLQALLLYLANKDTLTNIYSTELIYASENIFFKTNHLTALLKQLDNDDRRRIIVFEQFDNFTNHPDLDHLHLFNALYQHPNSRLIILNTVQPLNSYQEFYCFEPSPLSFHENMILMKYHVIDLEKFHQVTIPENILPHAFYLAKRYLPSNDKFKNALLLLDSAAGRIKNHPTYHDPVVNIAILNDVISCITQIPSSHLQRNQFNANEFIHAMQQDVIGQDDAIATIAMRIKQSFAGIQTQNGPLLSLLFAGCPYSGKKTMAHALVKHLFEQTNVIFNAQRPSCDLKSISKLKFYRNNEHQPLELKALIQQIPYAVIFIEDSDKMPESVQLGLQEILTSGFLSEANQQYDFHQAIIVLTTTQGALRLAKLIQPVSYQHEENTPLDLIKIVENEQNQHHLQADDSAEVAIEVSAKFSYGKNIRIIPFLPLTKTAIEKIIFKKLKSLIQKLEAHHNIELGFAPEIIRYLTEEALHKQDLDTGEIDIDEIFRKVYLSIEKAFFNRKTPKTLFLQLNETGQVLRCA